MWFLFSKLKKYFEFLSLYSCHHARDLMIMPSTFLSYRCSSFSLKTYKADKFSWLGQFWYVVAASWNCLFNCCCSRLCSLHLFIEYHLEYFLTLYLPQSHTDRGSPRSCFESCIQVGRRRFSSWTYSLSFRREQFKF